MEAKHGIWRPVKSGRLPRFSTRALLVFLIVLLLGPGLVFTSLLLLRYATGERDRYAQGALTSARHIAAVIDRDLNGLITTLNTLAISSRLRAGDFAGFHAQATQVSQMVGARLTLRTPDGRQMVNSAQPWGATLPTSHLAVDAEVIAIKRPIVSDVFLEPATNEPAFAVVVPVIIDGDFRYLLSLQAPTQRIATLLTPGMVGPWVVGIGDRQGTYVTRAPGHASFSGKPGVPAFLELATGPEGNFRGPNPYHEEILVGYARTLLSNWLVAASLPTATIEAPLRDEVIGFLGFGVLTLTVSIFLVFSLWRVASRPLRELANTGFTNAEAMQALDLHSPVREIHDLAAALLRQAQARDWIEDELRRNESRVRAILDTVPVGVVIAGPQGEVLDGNRELERFLGPESRRAGSFFAWPLSHGDGTPVREDELPVYRVLHGHAETAEIECIAETADGTRHWIRKIAAPIRDLSGSIVGAVASVIDIEREKRAEEILERQVAARTQELEAANRSLVAEMSSRQEAEQQVRQLQKMEAIGHLSGGIAHDFNNMLAVVMSALNMVERRLAKGETDYAKYLEMARDGATRAANLTKRLLAFSRQQALAPVPVDANKLVTSMSDLLRRTLGPSIRLETVLAGGLWLTHVDANQLESAILNLALNARDAMSGQGRLTIETANYLLDEAYSRQHDDVPPGQYVLIAITDTGAGMSPQVIARAFDPFFTTKDVGKGTGLGLSMVYGFVKQSGGHVKIYSEVGQGTTIKIYLPRFYGAEEVPSEDTRHAAEADGQGQLILLVEDEQNVRTLTADSLRELGYAVIEAEGAAAALRALDANPEIALLFTDIVMPDMNGRKLAEEAVKRKPDLRVIYTTGFTRNAVVHNGVLDPGVNFLPKPFTVQQLGDKLREVLARGT
ncbi:ATP-binding protein [Dongia deserti]|uniref:ATP-binding protein n=1 Tax=Dongia deserti TaxID=2268030 RepID=UPI000E6495FC|nr:ATP-binding protein [Dongia deserti]